MKENTLKNIQKDLILDIDGKQYYENFDFDEYGDTLEPGSMPAPYFYDAVISNLSQQNPSQPILGIEVGSFLGYSAISFAKKMKQHNPNSKLICVDTWLGSPEHFEMLKSEKKDNRFGWKNGYPTMYHKFISNVILNDVQDIIIPLPFPSTIGFKVLNKIFTKNNIKADFAYIDGSHEETEVYMDLHYYYQLTNQGGILCGDDWAWDSVKNDVIKFCSNNELKYSVHPNNVHWNVIV